MKNYLREMLRIVMLLFSLCFMTNVFAQRERNYIYLFDCTKSMKGYQGRTPDIWNESCNYLKNDIETRENSSTITVVPFTGEKYNPAPISFQRSSFDWNKIKAELDKLVDGNPTNTDICSSWDLGVKLLDNKKDNYFFLLTDGDDNCKGTDELCKRIRNWCSLNNRSYAYYVMLTSHARNNAITEAAKACDRVNIVDANGHPKPFGSFTPHFITINTQDKESVRTFDFSASGRYAAKASVCANPSMSVTVVAEKKVDGLFTYSQTVTVPQKEQTAGNSVASNPYFSVELENGQIENGRFKVKITALKSQQQLNQELPAEYVFSFKVQSCDIQILNEDVKVRVINKPERLLQMPAEEKNIGAASYYDAFLWKDAKTPDTLKTDLSAEFNREAFKDHSSATFECKDADGLKDFELYLNGKKLAGNQFTLNAGDASCLGVVYKPEAKEGKRYLNIKAIGSSSLERINEDAPTVYEQTLRSKYDVDWNPLKTILFWFGVILLALFLLWMCLLRFILFPRISKVGSYTIQDPYYSTRKLKGVYKVVFTNKRQSQGFLSAVFTGKIVYEVNDFWKDEAELVAHKKGMKLLTHSKYMVDTTTGTLERGGEYTIEKVEYENGEDRKATMIVS